LEPHPWSTFFWLSGLAPLRRSNCLRSPPKAGVLGVREAPPRALWPPEVSSGRSARGPLVCLSGPWWARLGAAAVSTIPCHALGPLTDSLLLEAAGTLEALSGSAGRVGASVPGALVLGTSVHVPRSASRRVSSASGTTSSARTSSSGDVSLDGSLSGVRDLLSAGSGSSGRGGLGGSGSGRRVVAVWT